MLGLVNLQFSCPDEASLERTLAFYKSIGFKVVEVKDGCQTVHFFGSSPPVTLTFGVRQTRATAEPDIILACSDIQEFERKLEGKVPFSKKVDKEGRLCLLLTDPCKRDIQIQSAETSSFPVVEPKNEEPCKSESGQTTPPLNGQMRRIAFLTSGGDSQGMNAAIRAIVRVAIAKGCEPYAVFEGYQGLVDGGEKIRKFGWNDVSFILNLGGTVIRTARCKRFVQREGRLLAAKNLVERGIDCLIVIGGDGSLTGADLFRNEWKSLLDELVSQKALTAAQVEAHGKLSIVGMVGSIDNDMVGTEITIGANSALHRIIEAVDCLCSTAYSHQRAFVVEVMGRHCGWLALMAAIATGADWLFIPEAPRKPGEWQDAMCNWISSCRNQGKRTALVILSEGAVDSNNNPIRSEEVRQVLESRLNMDARVTILGHVQRGGNPSVYDRILV